MPGRARGFTLIEILVAVVIIGIVMSVAVLSLTLAGDDRALREEARRFMALIELARDDAAMQGREFGVELMRQSYRFVEYDPLTNQWAETLDDDYLRYRALPEGIEFELYLEDQRVELEFDAQVIDYEERPGLVTQDYAPHLLVFSSGDATAFELHLVRALDDVRVGIQGDLLGNFEFMSDDEFDS